MNRIAPIDAASEPKSERPRTSPRAPAASAPAILTRRETISTSDRQRSAESDASPRDEADPSPFPARAVSLAPATVTEPDHLAARDLANLCEQFLSLTRDRGMSLRLAALELGKSPSTFSGTGSILARYQRDGLAGLLPKRHDRAVSISELTAQIEALGWFIPAARHYYMLTNRTWKSGSVPEAIRRTISLPAVPHGWTNRDRATLLRIIGQSGTDFPECPEDLREAILGRERNGLPLVPQRISRQITATAARVALYRNKRNFSLDFLNAPGGMRLFHDPATGERRLAKALEIVEGDDATINFPVCVPWNRGGTASADKFGVIVGRFQWLVFIDVGTGMILGYSYTARPRSSYRGEDVLSAMRVVTRAHGIPTIWRYERGVWKCKLVTGAVKNMGSVLDTVYSPHQKPFIEGLFNALWTKLSVHFPRAHVGRFQGEHDQANALLTACRNGHKDPRRHFPMLSQVLGAFDEVIAEKNRSMLHSDHHGRWIPLERFQAETAERPARRLDPHDDWLFAPFVREWTARGMLVGGRVPIFEGMSVPFDFSAPWLPDFDGARLRCHFDPADPRCAATLSLVQPWNGKPAGTILGTAAQINDLAGYTRLVMGWGDDPEFAGAKARQQTAAAMRREVRAIVPNGRRISESEERDGLGTTTTVETNRQLSTEPAPVDADADTAEKNRLIEQFERRHRELLV